MLRMIDIDLIRPRADARGLDAAKVAAIAGSVVVLGLINPVRVRQRGDAYELIAGGHRLAACRSLGLADIEAFIVADDDLKAELAMIDENLCRAELGPSDLARQTARRKVIYIMLHPETEQHVAGAHASNRAQGNASEKFAPAFAAETAKVTRQSERIVQLRAERGEKVIDEVLELIRGTSLDTGLYLDGLKRLPPNDQVTVAKRDLAQARQRAEQKARERTEAKKQHRQSREAELGARQQALPEAKFGVIYADPEWRFDTWSEAGMDRAADNHYPTSPLEAIKQRDIGSLAAEDAVLFLWATAPMLPQALEVMAAWGFDYKSQVVWFKQRSGDGRGTGYWFLGEHELLLVGTRGKVPAPAMGTQWRSVIEAPVGEHSEKPERFYELIEAYFPSLPKIELNARQARKGWARWGLEAPGDVSGRDVSAESGLSHAKPRAEAPVGEAR